MKSKHKTHKGVAKRMKVTAKGHVKRMKAGKSHINSHITGKRIRQLRNTGYVDSTIEAIYRRMLGH